MVAYSSASWACGWSFNNPGYAAFFNLSSTTFDHSSPRCERCEFMLLIQAIEHLVPAEDLPDWLEKPNVDLDGRSPKECIDAGMYEPVFTTLCLLEPCGPVS
jgi:hypothetical protein